MAVYKVNISLPPDLVEKIDEAAEREGVSRSGFIREASARYIAELRSDRERKEREEEIDRAIAAFRRIGAAIPKDFDYVEVIRAERERRRLW